MQALWQDVRYGVRMLWKSPVFTIVALAALAIGIGANTLVFSVVMAVLVRPLPYQDADRLVWLSNNNSSLGVNGAFLNPTDILDFRDHVKSFEQIASWGTLPVNISGAASPERVEGIYATTNFFKTLGIRPALGRDFVPADDERVDGNVIISHGLWQRQYGGAPDVIGRWINLGTPADQTPTGGVIVGVMPPELNFPARVDLWTASDYDRTDIERGGTHNNRTIARLKRGVSLEQAQAEISAVARIQGELYRETNAGWEVALVPFREHLFGSATVALPLLLGAVGFVLLIACSNVANLQLARAAARQKEIAVRLALGASRGRIIRQLLVEGVLLAVAGGAIGLLFAMWGIDVLRSFGPQSLPRLSDVGINFYVLTFTAVLSALTGIVFGLAPAWQASQPDLISTLKSAGQSSAAAPGHHRLRSTLVISQVALGLVLLAGAGLLLRSFWNILAVDPGFDSTNVLTAGVSLSFTDYPNSDPRRRQAFFIKALQRLSVLPGVESVGAISHVPLGGRTMQLNFSIDGDARAAAHNEALADFRVVTPALFETLRVPLKAGRVFTEHDTSQSPPVYIVNESFARTYLPNRDPLRERLRVNEFLPLGDIIGVVGDLKHRGLEADATPAFYVSYLQHSTFPIMNFVARTSTDPGSLSETVRRELQTIDRNQVVFNVRPLRQFLSDAVAQRRFSMLLLTAFAAIAVSLAASGIYGVMAYFVALKTRELGIRVALGAQAGDILALVLRKGSVLALIGVTAGLILALFLSQAMSSLLFGVSVTDPATFAAVACLMLGVALLACYVPARRATRVDPMVALRYE